MARLAVSDLATPAIAVFDARSGGDEELGRVTLHSSPVTAMKFSPEQGAVISADAAGGAEELAWVCTCSGQGLRPAVRGVGKRLSLASGSLATARPGQAGRSPRCMHP